MSTPQRLVLTLLLAILALVALARAVPLPERLSQPGGRVILWADGTTAHVFLAPDDRWRVPVTTDRVDSTYLEALVRLEDKRFQYHTGVDPAALVRAVFLNLSRGRVVSGGSTLTMQLVRVLEPRPRTISSKFVEALRAWQMEIRLSKPEILAAYLTFIPFGRNIEGIEAASLSYFGHSADALAADEIATLLAVPQNPNARYPRADHVDRLRSARDGIAQRLVSYGLFADEKETVLDRVRARPVADALIPFPRRVPHAATWLANRYADLRIPSTLDKGVQNVVDRALERTRQGHRLSGIHNTSVVVVEHATGEVRALVGSFDFWDGDHGGQIIGFDTPRSPGSALKPFVYARGIDRGLALPDMLVPDIPVQYGGFAPHNYDGTFNGLVRLQDALSQSLNIPFVNLIHGVGVEPLLATLRTMGVRSLSNKPGYYGLSVATGGIELTPLEMAGLYATLARDGRSIPLRVRSDTVNPDEVGVAVFTSGAAWLTRQALSIRDRPDFPARREYGGLPRGIHWKTGTSFGHRDAWALGSNARYTAAVWCGNFDNRPSIDLVGSQASGPMLFDILEGLTNPASPVPADRAPQDLQPVRVCAFSGYPASEDCPETKPVLAPVSSTPTTRCPYHVRLDVDETTGLALSTACRAGHRYRSETFVRFPATIRRFLGDMQRNLPSPPTFDPTCRTVSGTADRLRILNPPASQVVFLLPGMDASRQEIPFEAESEDGGELSWFVDGQFLGTAAAEERVWWTPTPGKHDVVVMEAGGRSDHRSVEVRGRP